MSDATSTHVAPPVLAVDVGGTKLEVGLVGESGEVLTSARTATTGGSGDELFATLAGLIDEVAGPGFDGLAAKHRAGGPPVVCGVGTGGPMGAHGEWVSPLNIASWREFPLRQRLADHTGIPVFVDNDAKALALGEAWVGAATDQRNFIAMVVSTGVGGGIVLDGRLLDGADGNAGHIGHVIVEPEGQPCVCGAVGCLEAETSGTAIAKITGAPAAEASPEVRRRTGMLVGRAVASVANLLDLSLALVAGSVALGYGDDFFSAAQAELDDRCRINHALGAKIAPAGLGTEGPLVGAAAVGRRGLGLPVGQIVEWR